MTERIDTKAVLHRMKSVYGCECIPGQSPGLLHQFRELCAALAQEIADREALEKEPNEWQAATRHLLEHYPEDVFPPNSNTPDAKAGTFARRLLTWLLDPVERARFAALAAREKRA